MLVRFVYGENDCTGLGYDAGWFREGERSMNNDASQSGMTLAHDCLEHNRGWRNRRLSDGADEVYALGAMLYLRGEGGYFWSRPNGGDVTDQGIGSELANEYHRGLMDDDPGRTRNLEDISCSADEWIAAIVQDAVRELANGYDVRDSNVRRYLTGWLRKGYRWAYNRIKRAQHRHAWGRPKLCNFEPDAYRATYLFQQLEREIEEATKWADAGCEMVVRFNLDGTDVSVKVYHWYEPGHSEYDPEEHREDW